MKILHLCLANYYIEGYGYQENILPKKHKQLGNEVTIITSRVTFIDNIGSPGLREAGQYINKDGLKVKIIDFDNKYTRKVSMILRLYKGLYKAIENENPDLMFIHGCQFWDIGIIVKYKKKHHHVKIVVDNHTDYINCSRKFLGFNVFQKMIWRHCAKRVEPYTQKFFGVTPMRVKFLKEIYKVKAEKVDLLVMGGDDDEIDFTNADIIRSKLRSQHNILDTDFLIVSGGKIDKKKNIHLLLRAINEIDNSKLKLIVFGNFDNFKDDILEFAQDSRIKLIGWIDSSKVYDWFLSADLAVFPGTHSVLWEQAVASGLPCIVKKWDGMEHVDVGGNCEFLTRDSSEEIKEAILYLLANKEKYNMMKDIAGTKGIKEFSYQDIARRSLEE